MIDPDEYTPKFKVGAVVRVHGGFKNERVVKITGRRVRRDESDTFYEFDDGTGAWEEFVEHTVENVDPEVAMLRVIHAFRDRLVMSTMTVCQETNEWVTVIALSVQHVPSDGWTERVQLSFSMPDERKVNTVGRWEYAMGDGPWRSAVNLGEAVVALYNDSMKGGGEGGKCGREIAQVFDRDLFFYVKVGDKMIMQVPATVRVLSIGPSDIAPGMRHYTYEVIGVEKRGESDCGIAVSVQIEKP